MNIGIVTTWFERGASYVSKQYLNALQSDDQNHVFVYARGGETYARNQNAWDYDFVTWGKINKKEYCGATGIEKKDFLNWIKNKCIDVILFNEQNWWIPVLWCKELGIKVGTYVDYYTEETVPFFAMYDYIFCNTKRHYEVFKHISQTFLIPWGTDTDLYNCFDKSVNENITFFHSAGMNPLRKGTDTVILAFLSLPYELQEKAHLIIHTQVPLEHYLKNINVSLYGGKTNIEVRTETVTAPGLYYLGDVYVYPSILDGLGLTVVEALSCGLPCIVSDNAPMNEFVVDGVNGKLASIEYLYSRSDGYFWPQCKVSIDSVKDQLIYYIKNSEAITSYRQIAREYAVQNFNWKDRYQLICDILRQAEVKQYDLNLAETIKQFEYKKTGKYNILPYAFYYWKKLKR